MRTLPRRTHRLFTTVRSLTVESVDGKLLLPEELTSQEDVAFEEEEDEDEDEWDAVVVVKQGSFGPIDS